MRTPPSLAALLPPLWSSPPWNPSVEGGEALLGATSLSSTLLNFFLTLASANSLSCPGDRIPAPNSIFLLRLSITFFVLFHICFIITTDLAPCSLWINWYFELFYGPRGCHISEYVAMTPNIACVLVCSGHHSKVPQNGWLKQQQFLFSKLWGLEVQDQGVGKAGFFGLWTAISSSLGFHMVFPLCLPVCLSYKDSSLIGSCSP